MATSGSGTTGSSQSRSLTFSWSRTGTSYTNNTSTISWSLKGSGSASGHVKCGGIYVKINGSVKYDESTDTRYTVYSGTTVKSGSGLAIKHNNDGTKTFNVVVKAGIYQYARNVSLDKDFTLEALTRTVTYNGNGSTSGSVSSQTKTYGTALTLRSNGYTKTGYNFVKWNTKADGTGTSYNAGASFTSEVQSTTLYAQWSIQTYTVSYNANGGTGAPSSQTKTYGTALTLSSTVPTRSGWTFVGWGTSSTATSKSYSAGGSYTTNAAITLYAIWSKVLTLSYSANASDGSGAPSSQSTTIYNATTSASFTISSTKPTLASSNFQGWATSSTATSAGYASGGSITISANTTLYAVWALKTYTVSYDANGGTGAPSSQTKTYGKTLTLSSTEPTKDGYLFQGWATSSTATEPEYQTSGNYTGNAAITLYAVWLVASKIGFIFTPPTYKIKGSTAAKAYFLDAEIPYTLTTTSENNDLDFYYKVYYLDSNTGNRRLIESNGGVSKAEIDAGSVSFSTKIILSGSIIEEYVKATKITDHMALYIETWTAKITDDTKAVYTPKMAIEGYTRPKVDYNLVYRRTDGAVDIRVKLAYPESFDISIGSMTPPTLVCNSATLSLTADDITSEGNNVYVYSYTIPAASASGKSVLKASYSDGLFEDVDIATIAATTADQVFKVLYSGASRAMAFVQDDTINGLKIFKDCRAYGKDFNEREDA